MPDAIIRDGYVKMLDDAGGTVEVPLESIQAAYQQGWTVEHPDAVEARERREAHSGLSSELLTSVEGVASGLSAGMSDQALVAALGDEYRASAQARAEVNPNARLIGEGVGMVAPALVTGGGSLAARAALSPGRALLRAGTAVESAAGKSLAGRIGGSAASGALEGAVQSMGRANAQAALDGTDLTAEKLLSAAGEGAMWGAAGGAAVAGGGAVIGKAGQAIGKRMLGEGVTLRAALSDHIAKRAVKKVTSSAIDDGADIARLGRKVLDADIPLHSQREAAKRVLAIAEKADDSVKRVAKLVDEAAIKPDTKRMLAAADEAAAKLREVPTREMAAAAKQVDAELQPLRDAINSGQDIGVSDLLTVRSALSKAAQGDSPSALAIKAVKDSLDKTIGETFDRAGDDVLHAAAAQGDELAASTLREQRTLKDAFRQAAEDADDWRILARAQEDEAAQPGLRDKLIQMGQSSVLGMLSGVATGDVNVGLAAAALGSKAGTAARNYVQERGMAGLMRMADRLTRVERQLDDAAAAIVSGKRSPATAASVGGAAASTIAWHKLRDQVVAAERGELQAEQMQHLGEHPEVALAVHQKLTDDAAYLRQRFPGAFPPPGAALQPMLAADESVSPLEVKRLASITRALNDPASAAEDLAAGRYDPAAFEAIRTRRPEVYNELRVRVLSQIAASPEPVPYKRRVLLGTAFQFDADWSMQPQNQAHIQSIVQPAPEESPQASQRANIEAHAERFAL